MSAPSPMGLSFTWALLIMKVYPTVQHGRKVECNYQMYIQSQEANPNKK